MANTVYDPETEKDRPVGSGGSTDFLRRRESLHNPDASDNQPAGKAGGPRAGSEKAPDYRPQYAPRSRGEGDGDEKVYRTAGNEPSDTLGEPLSGEGKKSSAKKTVPDRGELAQKEEAATGQEAQASTGVVQHENQVGRGWTGKGGSKANPRWYARHKRKLIWGGVSATLAGLSVALFFALLPLKILNVVNNLQNRFFATGQNAVQTETDNLFRGYVIKHVLPSYKTCGTTISKNCSINVVGTDPVSKLYRSWSTGRLENKLAQNYGIEFHHRADGWYLKTPSTSGVGLAIGENGAELDSAFKKVGISEIRGAISQETRWYQVYFRFKVGSLLQEKYGIRRCLIFCSVTDPLTNKVADQKIAAKLFLTQRVITPRNQTLGIAFECLLNGCIADTAQPTTDATPGLTGAEAGAPENAETDAAIRRGLTSFAARYGVTDSGSVDALVQTYKDISDKGFQKYLVTKGLAPFIGETTADGFTKLVPIAGWIDLTARLVQAGGEASQNLRKLAYVTNATAAVDLFSMYRTYADEIKSGHANATEVGSLVDSLGSGNQGSSTDPEVGGTASAEQAPLYDYLINGNTNASASSATASKGSLLSDLLGSQVLAASGATTATPSYLCNNGKGVPAGQLVCNEEILGQGNHYADTIKNIPGYDFLQKISGLWMASGGQVFSIINSILGSVFQKVVAGLDATCGLPLFSQVSLYCQAKTLASGAASTLVNAVTQWLIPNPFSTNMSGARTFDMMAAGADVAGNDSAHTTLGGQALTPAQSATITNQQLADNQQQYAQQSVFARLFSTSNPYSLTTKLAMALPMNSLPSIRSGIASFLGNPFAVIGHSFSTLFSGHAYAAATVQADPFGVTQYGYPAGTIPSDPQTYWNDNCSDDASHAYQNDAANNSWNSTASTTLDSNHMPMNNSTNPCLLIMATVGSDGATYSSDVLTADDQAN